MRDAEKTGGGKWSPGRLGSSALGSNQHPAVSRSFSAPGLLPRRGKTPSSRGDALSQRQHLQDGALRSCPGREKGADSPGRGMAPPRAPARRCSRPPRAHPQPRPREAGRSGGATLTCSNWGQPSARAAAAAAAAAAAVAVAAAAAGAAAARPLRAPTPPRSSGRGRAGSSAPGRAAPTPRSVPGAAGCASEPAASPSPRPDS